MLKAQSSFSELRRQMKNLRSYTVVQNKVRGATSDEPSYPSTVQLAELATLTNDPMHINKIMNMLWKRLNDVKNWRRVLKSLIVLEYLMKNGNLKVGEMCYDNVYLICMLQTYKCVMGNVDHALLIRTKADGIYKLLQDPELLAQEREVAAQKRHAEKEKIKQDKKKSPVGDRSAPRGVKEQQSFEEFSKMDPEKKSIPPSPLAAHTSFDSAVPLSLAEQAEYNLNARRRTISDSFG